ncbi:unnamed protein product [Spirodela intermedia]|uniref:Uncharacterized protein n=1 Tax=Spirodela intermedia TaxID=51605 RepID=A0A7I8IA71_SPIIN|nr:unnamed protein product [Spirodela intermedia]CAA6654617.1 unnamed protein product [Spirodela intermedia]
MQPHPRRPHLVVRSGENRKRSDITEFGMLELVLNPRVMKKAQEEVRRVVGRKLMAEDSDIANLPYLNLVVKEIFRLHPPAPLSVPHESFKDANICGYHIPAKTAVLINLWAIMRDPGLWKDPDVFWPERFEERISSTWARTSSTYLFHRAAEFALG